jgi:uncharacterized protein (TIGR02600 family)
MKHFPPLSQRRRGVALIAVLALIVLMAALITIFLVRTGTERSASASYDAAASTRLLGETTVNLVQATINQATSGTGTAWASQPGAIRIFNDAGALTRIFRLYSGTAVASDTSSGAVLAGDVPPANWSTEPAAWVDLNKPVTVTGLSGSNSLVFPILDPRDPQNPGTATAPSILTSLEGFSINSAPGATTLQPAPMPVRWLYVLRDGQIVTPTNSTSTSATVPGATSDNPITGRIAFWTDDETAKVNVNTAAGSFSTWNGTGLQPAPWDVPRFRMLDDRNLFSRNQPVQGEYQRYPGHPASTDLSKIFTALAIPMGGYPGNQTSAGTSSSFFDLLSRYDDKTGSKGGTVNTTTSNTPITITAKNDRLYTAPGEMLFRPDRTNNPGTSPSVTRQQLETGKFLLTSHSRAPEVTLFGTPRIAIWPIDSEYGANPTQSNTTKLASTFDKLIAFCSTTGRSPNLNRYYFQRHDSTSPTNDWTQIPRNQTLYSYLQDLTGQTGKTIPGFGGNFSSKYATSNERDQILTEIVDYIRCTNLYDHSMTDANPSSPAPRFTPLSNNPATGGGQVVPLRIGNTQGLGRMYTISELALLLVCTADGNGSAGDFRDQSNQATNATLADTFGGATTTLNSEQKRLQAMILVELTSPMHGFDMIMPDISINIRNLNGVTFKGTDDVVKNPFPSGDLFTQSPGVRFNGINMTGALNGFQYFMSQVDWSNSNYRRNAWSNPSESVSRKYTFVSNPFTVPTDTDGNGSVELGTTNFFVVELMVKEKGTSTRRVVQTFQVSFPAATLPLPDLISTGVDGSNPSDWWGFDKRIEWATREVGNAGGAKRGVVIRTDATGIPDSSAAVSLRSDVVRSLAAKSGDVRLVAARETVEANGTAHMTMTPNYTNTGIKLAHTLMQASISNGVPGVDLGGKLVPGANYEPSWVPKVPSNVSPGADWDWDSGLPGTRDGAYANKPDEGNIYSSSGASPYFNGENQANSNNIQNMVSYFTANRIIPSAVMFGSLPTGVKEGIPWRTLLFRPQASRPRDPVGPKDHLLLDLFNMPVVEPYAISEPFSTAGKVNMNYQIVPFTYINRNTGVRAVLGSELVARVPKAAAQKNTAVGDGHNYYKIPYGNVPSSNSQPPGAPALGRLPLNLDETTGSLRQFREKFDAWDIFKSPSEICDIYLVPQGYSWATNTAADAAWYGDDFALVGDNVRERPYANIYPRLTTKSNTFTVHYTVQALKNPPGQNPEVWNESRGVVTGELRGSTTLERFLDPADSKIPDYAANPNAASLDTFYQWRVISANTFAP